MSSTENLFLGLYELYELYELYDLYDLYELYDLTKSAPLLASRLLAFLLACDRGWGPGDRARMIAATALACALCLPRALESHLTPRTLRASN